MKIRSTLIAAAILALGAAPALAGDTWTDLRAEIYGERMPVVAPDVVTLDAPYRTMTDPRTPLGASITAPAGEFITRVSLIIDDNPMPVSAVFDMAEPRARFAFEGTMRVNGPTPVRVVVETDRGGLYMQEAFVKTSGVGACAAPPGTDPAIALETLGQMKLALVPGRDTEAVIASLSPKPARSSAMAGQMAELSIDHPSHSGMQMDQITLLYIPARFVHEVTVKADGRDQFTMTGSISFSENPAIRFELPAGTGVVDVRLTDTEGATFDQSFPQISG